MPHRVATFFRQHSNSFDLPADLKKKTVRRSSSSRPNQSPASSSSSLNFSEDRSVKMPVLDGHKRLSLTGLTHSPKSSSRSIPQLATLSSAIESPPLVFYGPSNSSSGALLSGQITLQVNEDFLCIDQFKMRMALEVTRKKPFHSHCQECANQSTDLTTWTFLQGPATLKRGEHNFPFSFLLPGHLPASMKGALSSIEYALRATLAPKNGEPMLLTRVLDVKRAIYPGENPRTSVRIFPPTNLTANCQLPSVIHPIGESSIHMRMDGVVQRKPDTRTQIQWKLKRLTWRLDETQKMISPACPKHAAKLGNTEEGKKGTPHEEVRTIGTEEIKSGWKGDYSGADGSLEMEFKFGIQPGSHPICDLKAEDGTEVSHVLVVEMIVTEEFAKIGDPKHPTPTGSARVLRMHFSVTVTERAGLGISWDEEQPPLYGDVPESPPGYNLGHNELYDGEPIPDYEDLLPMDDIIVGVAAQPGPSNTGPS